MAKVDRLGWADGFAFSSYGARIGIRVNAPEAHARLRSLLPPRSRLSGDEIVDEIYSVRLARPATGSRIRQYNLVYRGATRIARSLELDEALEALQSCLHLSVAECARGRLFVHAGVVGWHGRAILLPGRSMAGKTSLVHALVQAGADYYSDEYAAIDSLGRVHAYPKPLSLRIPESDRKELRSADELGGRTGKGPLPVGLIAVTQYREEARWRPRPLTPGQALMALLDNTVLAISQPQVTLKTLGRVAPKAVAIKSLRADAGETAASLLSLLGGGSSRG